MFSSKNKKRAAGAPTATAAPANAPEEEPAAKRIDASRPPKNDVGGAVNSMESSVANLSQFDTGLISKNTENAALPVPFDNVAGGGMDVESGKEGSLGADAGEVPMTIPATGEDVEDDLTENTNATYSLPLEADAGVDVEPPYENFNVAGNEQEISVSKTSPYFPNPTDNQVVAQQGDGCFRGTEESRGAAAEETSPQNALTLAVDNNPPSKEITIPGTTSATTVAAGQPSPPKLGEHSETTAASGIQAEAGAFAEAGAGAGGDQEPAKTAEANEDSKHNQKPTSEGLSGMPPPHQGTQRASEKPLVPNFFAALSPPGPNANQTNSSPRKGPACAPRPGVQPDSAQRVLSPPGTNANQTDSFSPKGQAGAPIQTNTIDVSRPTNQANSFSPKGPAGAPRPGINVNQAASLLAKGAGISHSVNKHSSLLKGRNTNGVASSLLMRRVQSKHSQSNANVEAAKTIVDQHLTGGAKNANESTHPAKNDGTVGFDTDPAGTFSPQQGATRVSLSPRSDQNAGQVETAFNQNDIVIPGVSSTVANACVGASQAIATAQPEARTMANAVEPTLFAKSNATQIDSVICNATVVATANVNSNGQPGQKQNRVSFGNANGSSRPTNEATMGKITTNHFGEIAQTNDSSRAMQPPVNTGANANRPSINHQKPSSNSSRGIGKLGFNNKSTEKVRFAVPGNGPTSKSATNMALTGGKDLEQSNGHIGSKSAAAPSSTAITPDHRRYQGNAEQQAAVTPLARSANGLGGNNTVSPTPHKAPAPAPMATATQHDSALYERVVPGMTPAVKSRAMEAEPRVEERRPQSNTAYTPPPKTRIDDSSTPKVSNVNATAAAVANPNQEAATASYPATNLSLHTDDTFEELLSQFVQDIQEGTDIYERGQNELLDLDVDLSHAFAGILRYKEDYMNLLEEVETMTANADAIISEMDG